MEDEISTENGDRGTEVNQDQLASYADQRERGASHAEAVEWFARIGASVDGELLRTAYETRTGEVWSEPAAPALIGETRRSRPRWFAGGAGGRRWQHVRGKLTYLDDDALDLVHRASDKVVGLLDPPHDDVPIATRGLVLGYVQSGKTTNFTAVAAKAADAGFSLIVVLAGIHNSLRQQTQLRLYNQLVHDPSKWWSKTIDADFQTESNPPESLLRGRHFSGLLVVKKNVFVLQKLNNWLDQAEPGFRRTHSILVIDDEADQAGIDVAPKGTFAGVHDQLRKLLSWGLPDMPRVAYVGYTATPYANILTDTDAKGLYPGDFLVDLPKPAGYMGAELLFGADGESGLDAIRRVDEDIVIDPDGVSPGELPDSLEDAISWFVLASAARRVIEGRWTNSSMLIHVSQLRLSQYALRAPIRSLLEAMKVSISDPKTLAGIRATWDAEITRVPAHTLDETAVSFNEIEGFLPEVLGRLIDEPECPPPDGVVGPRVARSGVIVDNSLPQARRITYPSGDHCAVTVIVIGGNTLSRGLTLEGLVCSYFSRTARAYDTLMQMGRWFGFRPRYGHLTRIWMTPELRGWFADLTEVEAEIRTDIRHLEMQEGKTPRDYAVRVRTHPQMAITRAAAMQNSTKAYAHLGDQQLQMTRFKRWDEVWLKQNLDVAVHLLEAAENEGTLLTKSGSRAFIRDVPLALIRRFLDEFQTVDRNLDLQMDLIQKWIDAEQEDGRLSEWTVGVLGAGGDRTQATLGAFGSFGTIVRTRLDEGDDTVGYIKTLMSPGDARLDHSVDPRVPRSSPAGVVRRGLHEPPLLLIYPIDPLSPTGNSPGDRHDLGAVASVIGVAFVFPDSPREAVSYMTADLSKLVREEPDDPETDPDWEEGS